MMSEIEPLPRIVAPEMPGMHADDVGEWLDDDLLLALERVDDQTDLAALADRR